MGLSNDLISQFAKITNDKSKSESKPANVYGKTVIYNGNTYVQLDGSDLLTPVETTSSIKDGDRVTVKIEDHTATVTGNLSDPSASSGTVTQMGNQITEFEIVLADKVSTKELEAESARIDNLVAEDVTIKGLLTAAEAEINSLIADDVVIRGRLDAAEANVKKLDTEKLSASMAEITYATITDLDVTNANVNNLSATYGEFEDLTAKNFAAVNASIQSLDATKLNASTANITYATIAQLNAAKADIDVLDADVADINTLIFGSASGGSIQSSFANAVVAQISNAQIKSAMIDSIVASKITSGDINTNNVRVVSEDGKLLIADETIQISDKSRVRVQIGKDAAGDYSINIWDANGNLMFSEGGITDDAIKEAIIRNEMVSDNANINASKLDIGSLFTVINNDGTHTINSSRVLIDSDNQTLDVAFTKMTSDISSLNNTVSTQGTQISVIQGQISSKIWEQDITTAVNGVSSRVDTLNTKYSSLEQTVNGISSTVASHTTQINNKADNSTVTNLSSQVTSLSTTLDGFKSTVSSTYATKTELSTTNSNVSKAQAAANAAQSDIDNLEIGGRNYILNSDKWTLNGSAGSGITQSVTDGVLKIVSTSGNGNYKSFSRSNVIEANFKTGDEFLFAIEIKSDDGTKCPNIYFKSGIGYYSMQGSVSSEYSWCYYTGTWKDTNDISFHFGWSSAIGTYYIRKIMFIKGNKLLDWTPAPEDMATNSDLTALTSRVTTAETAIDQNSDAIALRATKAEVTTAKNDAISSANTNTANELKNYSTTAQMNAAIEVSANSITSSVSSTYATKSALNSVDGKFAKYTPKTLPDTRDDNQTPAWYITNYPQQVITEFKKCEVIGLSNIGTFCTLTTHVPWPNNSGGYPKQVASANGKEFWRVGTSDTAWGSWNDALGIAQNAQTRVGTAESNIIQLSNKIAANVNEIDALGARMSSVELEADSLTTTVTNVNTIVNSQNGYKYYKKIVVYGESNKYYPVVFRGGDQTIARDILIRRGYSEQAPADWYSSTHKGGLYLLINTTFGGWGGAGYFWDINHLAESYCNMFAGAGHAASYMCFYVYLRGGGDTGAVYSIYSDQAIENTFMNGSSPQICYDSDLIGWSGGTADNPTYSWYAPAPISWSTSVAEAIAAKKYVVVANNAKKGVANLENVTGDIATTASDAQSRVAAAESTIRQLADAISMLITDANGSSLMTQTSTGWTFSMGDMINSLTEVANSSSTNTTNINTINSAINGLQSTVDDLGDLANYVRITTSGSEPCIELGETDSDFKLRITNTQIEFKEGSTVVAYMTNTSLNITKAVIEDELQLGSFVWQVRQNGNLGLLWKG